jgi:hypothetical protein
MSISYNAIIGNKGKATLPSVESWGTNNNILRDPPKSVMTRRIDKVNQDGSLNEMFYHSGDRFAENINVYARGVNPMVSVQYGNVNGGANAKLPYRIMNGGAFRPPELRQEQLLPLSRQPRLPTKVVTNKEFIDYSKSALCDSQPKKYRQIVEEKVEGFIVPTRTMKIQTPVKEHFEVSYVLDAPLRGDYYSNLRSTKEQYSEDINIELERNIPLHFQTTNKSENIAKFITPDNEIVLESNIPAYMIQTSKFQNIATSGVLNGEIVLQNNMPHYLVQANRNQQTGEILLPDNEIVLQNNIPHYLLESAKADNTTYVKIAHENDYKFENNRPTASAQSRKTLNIQKDLTTRSYNRLAPALRPGEFKGVPTIPQTERNINYNSNYKTSKIDIAQKIMKELK